MKNKGLKIYLFQGICVMVLILISLASFLVTNSLKVAEEKIDNDYIYVSYEILSDNVVPVIKEENVIIRPYKAEGVSIAKNYYDYKSEEHQEDSIIYYQNTYIQNKGVDYKKDEAFEVIAVLKGKVISITEDDIVGKTIKIEHDNNIISTYQSLGEVNVHENELVNQGQIIGTSGTNSINADMGNHLHFELFYDKALVNPEEYFNKKLGEI